MIVILYTTKYREGGPQFKRVAETLARELIDSQKAPVKCHAVESKQDVKAIFHAIKADQRHITHFHFIGHSGMYGPMFGTVAYPEQFSPWEWENLEIPFEEKAEAWFHCCRSARWFAPYFARTFNIKTHGYHWYTSFSQSKVSFKADWPQSPDKPLYAMGWKGKKSHGWSGAVRKRFGLTPPEEFLTYEAESVNGAASYNSVAELYDAVFQDIKVRRDEWDWLAKHIPDEDDLRVLDIGCGNGALLKQLAPNIKSGSGVDASEEILKQARRMNERNEHVDFHAIDGPVLPFPDNSFDLVTSLLSFRYLDWDPLMDEIKRVLTPKGRMLIVDMVTAPVQWKEFPKLLSDKVYQRQQQKRYPEFHKNLHALVSHPDWKTMLQYNPIRSEHEMKWYLESRFPGQKAEVINVGWNARVMAFDTGSFSELQNLKLTYP